ncbi:MAG: T9SS type A sorting domain-containing protein [candidate division WOR-3 bacterium]
MIIDILISLSFIIQDTWEGGRDTSIINNDTLKTFLNGFQIDPFVSGDSLFISKDSLILVNSSTIFDIGGDEVKGIGIKSEDTVFVGIFDYTYTQANLKVFYTLDSLNFSSGRIFYSPYINFNSVRRFYFTKDYGNNLWVGSKSSAGWILYSNELKNLPPQNFSWTSNTPYVAGHDFSDFLIFSPFKMYCSTNRGRIFRYIKAQNVWESIYQFPSVPGQEPDARTLLKTKNGLGIAVIKGDGTGIVIYETLDDVNFYPISPLLPSKSVIGGVLSERNNNLILACNLPTACYLIKDNNYYVTFQNSDVTIFDIFKSKSGIIYLLTYSENTNPKRRIYASYDGVKWNLIETLDHYSNLGSLIPNTGIGYKKNEILIGTSYKPRLFKSKYQRKGTLTSNFIKIKGRNGPIHIKGYKIKGNPVGSFSVRFRSFNNVNDTVPFSEIPPLFSDTSSLSNYIYINPLDTFIQYKLELFTSNPEFSPYLDYIKIYYEEDTVGPKVLKAEANDGTFQQDGKDPDDHVIFIFSEPTSKLEVNKYNVDTLFKLSNNHSWLNSYGDFGGALWSLNGETLRIYLAYSGNNYPTVSVGDTVLIKMEDRFGFWKKSKVIITGSFDDVKGPKLIKAIAKEGNVLGDGIENGDSLILIFNEPTNRPNINFSNVDSFFGFKINGNFGNYFYSSWLTPEILVFVFTGSDSKIYTYDTIFTKGYRIFDIKGNISYGKAKIEGSFDLKNPVCDSILAYDNSYPDTSIDYDDFIAFYFSENIFTLNQINKFNINSVFKLSKNHSWLSGFGQIGNILVYDKYIFVFLSTEGGKPSVRPGDTVYFMENFIFDLYNNPLSGFNILRGSFTKVKERNLITGFNEIRGFMSKNRLILTPSQQIEEIKIFDITGRNVNFKILEEKDKINILNLKRGSYFILVKDKNKKIYRFKLIKLN